MAEGRGRRGRGSEQRRTSQRRGGGGDDRGRRAGGYEPGEGRQAEAEPGDTTRIHQAYLEERLGGGAPADAEAYRRAREQFLNLPGAQRATPHADLDGRQIQPGDTEANPATDGPSS